ncbi:MAG: hypothetical protein C4523_16255 [Myxococcales bacterium]|nr:MAG: hypothetical protein C4523_16255 [Myxococcales bacterium]
MLQAYFAAVWEVLLDLSPALLLGLLLAGLLHEFLPKSIVRAKLSGSTTRAVLSAVLIGVPMPLCSCGVVPAALGLKNDGASKGAATGFLISTPQTGVDSVLVSASFLGWPFALFKVAAAFVTGMIGGVLVNLTGADEPASPAQSTQGIEGLSGARRLVNVVRYAIFDLLAMIDLWLVAGVALAALITTLIPPGYLSQMAWIQGIGGMLLMLAIALPLYVCTTSSVPIAASLIAAGMPTGAALVFLMAGPATNVATLGAVYRGLGGRVLAIYLGTVAALSMLFGSLFNFVLPSAQAAGGEQARHHHAAGAIDYVAIAAAVAVIALVALLVARRLVRRVSAALSAKPEENDMEFTLKVGGMNCQHCVANVKKAIEAVPEVEEATPVLETGLVRIKGGNPDRAALAKAVLEAGYKVETP